MIGRSKNGTENYPRECFWTQEKETWVKFNPGLSANRPSNNWAQGLNSLLAGDPLRRTFRAALEGFRLRESWLLKKWWSTMPPSQRLSFFALWSHRGRNWLVMKRAGSWDGERRQAKRHLARFLLPTVLYAQKGMSVKGADERLWGLQSSVRRPYITHLPVRCLCYQYLIVRYYWFLNLYSSVREVWNITLSGKKGTPSTGIWGSFR